MSIKSAGKLAINWPQDVTANPSSAQVPLKDVGRSHVVAKLSLTKISQTTGFFTAMRDGTKGKYFLSDWPDLFFSSPSSQLIHFSGPKEF